MIDSNLQKLIRDSIDDDRMYHMHFPTQPVGTLAEPPTDVMKELLETEVEKLEQTVGCVATVITDDRHKLGPTDHERVILFVLLPRHADADLVARLLEEIRHRVMTEANERQQKARSTDDA